MFKIKRLGPIFRWRLQGSNQWRGLHLTRGGARAAAQKAVAATAA